MKRLLEIHHRVNEIGERLNNMYPNFKTDREISNLVTELKEYAQVSLKELQRQLQYGELTNFERYFIEPAIHDSYMTSINKMRKGMVPSEQLNNLIWETDSTISYWISAIEEAKVL
ncbi:MAG: hypothetical protein LKF77_08770 [Proteus vulgaris]|jgi:hypothetical protein|nr:hypothetical protein [Proteus vulgaris]